MLLLMIFPLAWSHLYVPALTKAMLMTLQSYRAPFLCGVLESVMEDMSFPGVQVAHLDTGTIICDGIISGSAPAWTEVSIEWSTCIARMRLPAVFVFAETTSPIMQTVETCCVSLWY